jgi:N-ethylmaleimide reductase
MRPDAVTYTTAAATNLRSDEWGGSVRNRIRFAVEVVRAIAHTIGAHRTALRISPSNPFDDMSEPRAAATYFALVERLRPLSMAYLHVVEVGDRALTIALRARYRETFVLRSAPHRPAPTAAHRGRHRRPHLLRRVVSGQPRPAADG